MSSTQLEKLVKLQNIDLEIKVIKKELNFLSYETDKHRTEMEAVLKTLNTDRDAICTEINNAGLLSRIARLQGRYQGIFLAPVVNSVCFGCRMTIPAGLMVQLVKGNELVYCEDCGRILRKVDSQKFSSKPAEPLPSKRGRKPKHRPIF
jgi:uncharacterized protein